MAGRIRVLQVNLHHSKAATASLAALGGSFDVALIQEPWIVGGKIRGLGGLGGVLIHSRNTMEPRTCILVNNNFDILPQGNFCSRDLTAVKLRINGKGGMREVTIGSAYLPYDDPEPPPPREMEELVMSCRASRSQLIIGCDANAHHRTWGSTDTNNRGESLLQFIMANNLDILNVGNKPTFVTSTRKEVIDITLGTNFISNYVKSWNVSEEESFSDHRYIRFNISCEKQEIKTYRNPRRTDWEVYTAELDHALTSVTSSIRNKNDLEVAAGQLQDAVISAYENSCPEVSRRTTRNVPWWNKELDSLRKQARKQFNKAKYTGEWGEYRNSLTVYNKVLRKAKRESWRRHCEEIEHTHESARLLRILSKEPQNQTIYSLKNELGEYTESPEATMKELFRVHFPGCTMTDAHLDDSQEIGLVTRPTRVTREDWQIARQVIDQEKVEWAISTFEPYKSPGPDGIYPILLQKGSKLLHNRLCNILRASLAMGHIPKAWRLIRVAFIPKPGKIGQDSAKALRPISLMSFVLKTLEKLLDRHIRDVALVNNPLQPDQYAYRSGTSTETALHKLVDKIEQTLTNKEVAIGAFLDIQGAFDNTSFQSIARATRQKHIDETSCRWIDCMLKSRVVYTNIMGETAAAGVAGGCPQGGVLSPLLWNLVMDELITKLRKDGHTVMGYADDLVILAHGKYNRIVRDRIQQALNIITKWTTKEGLHLSPSKSTIVIFTKRRNLEGTGPISLQNVNMEMSREVKYLGVILDSRLTWTQHLDRVIKRAETSLVLARRTHGKLWGLKPDMTYWLYNMVVKPMITYASLVWWPKTQQATARSRLSKVQRLACLGITGAMKTTPTAAMEVLLDLPPLHLVIRGEARLAQHRLQNALGSLTLRPGHRKIVELVDDRILEMRTDHIVPQYKFNTKFGVEILDREVWKTNSHGIVSRGLTWYTDGSKTGRGTGAGIYGGNTRMSCPLGQYATVFQTEVYAILRCAQEIGVKGYEQKRIHIMTDSRAAIGALSNPKITSELVLECREELNALGDRNSVKLCWVPGHCGITGNEKADELARRGSAAQYLGPEPAIGIPKKYLRKQVAAWVRSKHKEHWAGLTSSRHGRLFIKEPITKRAKELLSMSRLQLRTIVGYLTGHAPVKAHLHKMGVYNADLNCRLCNRELETAHHILCDCEALDRKRQRIFGEPKLVPETYSTQAFKDLYKLVQGTILLDWVQE